MNAEATTIQQATTLIVLNRRYMARKLALAALLGAVGVYLVTLESILWQVCGWFVVAVAIMALIWNGLLIWKPARFASLSLGDRNFEYRIGLRTRIVDYLAVGKFHLVNYLGGDCLVWRTQEDEGRLDALAAAMPPDPIDEMPRCLQLPRSALSDFTPAEICARLNGLRAGAREKAGLAEERVEPDLAAVRRAECHPFLAPPRIGRALFALTFLATMPIYLVAAFICFPIIRNAIVGVATSIGAVDATLNRPPFAATLATYAILLVGYYLLVSCIVLARSRDFDRTLGWPAAFSRTYDLLAGGAYSRALEMSRLLLRRGVR